MKIGEKEVEIKDLADTVKCNKRVIEHIRKRQIEDGSNSSKNKSLPQEQIMLSEQEKCFRTTLVRVGLFTFCSLGLGKPICESYDMIKDEEKRLGRKLSDHEVHQIVIDIAKRYKIVSDDYTDNITDNVLENKGG
jgi:hypothetical protein